MARRSGGSVLSAEKGDDEAGRFGSRPMGASIHPLGRPEDGWTRRRAEEELENVLADVRRGIWRPEESVRKAGPPEPLSELTFAGFPGSGSKGSLPG